MNGAILKAGDAMYNRYVIVTEMGGCPGEESL